MPNVPNILTPRESQVWERLAERAAAAISLNQTLERNDTSVRSERQLCEWARYPAVELRTCGNWIPKSANDCDLSEPGIWRHIHATSWSKSGIGCAFWHTFAIGPVLESALVAALREFQDWKVASNRTENRVFAIHVRGGDKNLVKTAQVGRENPYVSRLRRVGSTLVKELGRCANERAKTLRWRDVTLLLLSDDARAKASAEVLWPGRVYASRVVAAHSGLSDNATKQHSRLVGSWVDLMLAALCDGMVTSPSPVNNFSMSSFSMAASEIGMYFDASDELLVRGGQCLEVELRRWGLGCTAAQGTDCHG